MDSVKQSAALCLLRLYRTSPDLVPMGEWAARVVHLLNDQHLVRVTPTPEVEQHCTVLLLLLYDAEDVYACPSGSGDGSCQPHHLTGPEEP